MIKLLKTPKNFSYKSENKSKTFIRLGYIKVEPYNELIICSGTTTYIASCDPYYSMDLGSGYSSNHVYISNITNNTLIGGYVGTHIIGNTLDNIDRENLSSYASSIGFPLYRK